MSPNNSLISVIMPAYNASAYIEDSIQSVINQSYPNWELLIVNDGSIDDTEQKVLHIMDTRIKYFSQTNQGVSVARNKALANMKGDFFCFLDADDVLTEKSIELRLNAFTEDTKIMFVDGQVLVMDATLTQIIKTKTHTFKGKPYHALLQLDERCFFGLSWMIKRKSGVTYRFREGLTHAEDLLFYIELSKLGGAYVAVDEPVLKYRQGHNSAMRNLSGLEKGYLELYRILEEGLQVDIQELQILKSKLRSIMFKSYLAGLSPLKAIETYMKFNNL